MKVLTLTQPWASLIAVRAKRIETRSWRTSYRGPLAIHAAAGLGPVGGAAGLYALCSTEPFRSALRPYFEQPSDLPRGAIVALVNLIGCYQTPIAEGTFCVLPTGLELPPTEPERSFGDYSPRRWAWLLADIHRLQPIPARGALGLWDYYESECMSAFPNP